MFRNDLCERGVIYCSCCLQAAEAEVENKLKKDCSKDEFFRNDKEWWGVSPG